MISVLFVCANTVARGQMAEEYLKKFGAELFLAESAGLELSAPDPCVQRAMREDGIEVKRGATRSVFNTSSLCARGWK